MSKIEPEIAEFVDAVGAEELKVSEGVLESLKKQFGNKIVEKEKLKTLLEEIGEIILPHKRRRSNYFLLEGRPLVVKISRTDQPFWGVGKDVIDSFNKWPNYYLILLVSGSEGWVFSKAEVNANINRGEWKLREKDKNYKINPPLPDSNAFVGPKAFRKMIGINEP